MLSAFSGWFPLMMCLFVGIASATKCTNVLHRKETQEVLKKEPCIQKYTARCGWLSLNYCTFYHSTYCDRKANETITLYYIETTCCEGFYQAKNGSCLKKVPGVSYEIYELKESPTADAAFVKGEPVDAGSRGVTDKMSVGVYAGIACGTILLATIAAFIGVAVRKRKRRQLTEKRSREQHVVFLPANSSASRNSFPKTEAANISHPATAQADVPFLPENLDNSPESEI
ncbi:uncharacterized protein LOC127841946 isoform X1 [Dreissena polymorpha]|uniref:Uncharacterized protein n=1 Tax=Dreissena polymorpha TaxID=45954 RepID=A0A9D4MYG4_DREPO|nr:uncharacterized protein LOC127841946 isoform X1 [Dreissena polymorpha]KAH3886233.1 hypothetical protein DPMN_010234 [Dreissena polymorpha]